VANAMRGPPLEKQSTVATLEDGRGLTKMMGFRGVEAAAELTSRVGSEDSAEMAAHGGGG